MLPLRASQGRPHHRVHRPPLGFASSWLSLSSIRRRGRMIRPADRTATRRSAARFSFLWKRTKSRKLEFRCGNTRLLEQMARPVSTADSSAHRSARRGATGHHLSQTGAYARGRSNRCQRRGSLQAFWVIRTPPSADTLDNRASRQVLRRTRRSRFGGWIRNRERVVLLAQAAMMRQRRRQIGRLVWRA